MNTNKAIIYLISENKQEPMRFNINIGIVGHVLA